MGSVKVILEEKMLVCVTYERPSRWVENKQKRKNRKRTTPIIVRLNLQKQASAPTHNR